MVKVDPITLIKRASLDDLADITLIPLEVSKEEISGAVTFDLDLSPLRIKFKLKAMDAMEFEEGVALLCEGPGNLGVAILISNDVEKVGTCVLDCVHLDSELRGWFKHEQVTSLLETLEVLAPAIKATYTRPYTGKEWASTA